MRARGLLLACALLLAGCNIFSDANSLVNDTLATDGENYFILGLADVGSINDIRHRVVSQVEYGNLKCLANLGYLKFLRDENGPNEAYIPMQLGLTHHIETALTPLGEEANSRFHASPLSTYESTRPGIQFLKLRFTNESVTEVMDDKKIDKDTDVYRVIKSKSEATWTDDGKLFAKSCGGKLMYDKKRTIILYKKDSFTNKWLPVIGDVSYADSQFVTNLVENYLKNLH